MTHEERKHILDNFGHYVVECRFCGIHSDIYIKFNQNPDGDFAHVYCAKCGTSGPTCDPTRALFAWSEMMQPGTAKSKYTVKT